MYIALPLDEEVVKAIQEYELEKNIPIEYGRNPTPNEVLAVCRTLVGYNQYSGFAGTGWQLDIEHEEKESWSLVHIHEVENLDQRGSLAFEKGHPELLVKIAGLLTKITGPIAIFPDTGDAPIILDSNTNISHALQHWEHTVGIDDDGTE